MVERAESFYTPDRVASLLFRFGDLEAMAETPGTAHGLSDKRPTPPTPKTGARQKGFPGDQRNGACVVADLEAAWRSIEHASLEFQIIELVMFGYTLSGIAAGRRMGKQRVWDAFHVGCAKMAGFLGWIATEDESIRGEQTADFGYRNAPAQATATGA